MRRRGFLKLISTAALSTTFPCCNSVKQQRYWSAQAFHTNISVTIGSELSDENYANLVNDLEETAERISLIFSLERENSELTKLNQRKHLKASPEFIEVIQRCIQYAISTEGIFDITVQPLWEWYAKQSKLQTLELVLEAVSYKHIHIEGSEVTLTNPNSKLTLNGMIQGYLTDQLYQVCVKHNIQEALINGGEFRAIGTDANKQAWQVPIRGKNGKKLSTQYLADGEALAVSAGYGYTFNNSLDINHIFDPVHQTKTSKESTIIVKAKSAEQADVYATVLSLLPASRQKQIDQELISFEVLVDK